MKLTEAMAGATLLAFSNGATDVITAVISSTKANDDLTVGALFGASLFAMTIILAVLIFAKNGSRIQEVSS